jgi:hypothetical protein
MLDELCKYFVNIDQQANEKNARNDSLRPVYDRLKVLRLELEGPLRDDGAELSDSLQRTGAALGRIIGASITEYGTSRVSFVDKQMTQLFDQVEDDVTKMHRPDKS